MNHIDLKDVMITRATSSLTAEMDACGTNTAHSSLLSCPLISVFMAAVSKSVIRAVCKKYDQHICLIEENEFRDAIPTYMIVRAC